MLSARLFYGKRDTVVVPVNPAISDDDDDSSEEEGNDVADPNFLPPTTWTLMDLLPKGSACGMQWRCL
ncbi:hypothetical protein DPEC_G00221720 [Dallia pectoralis]|uniref:Uncharacterized protein n=1 Tax=Dallia pectoralis TaxID=75939 RepID=A0ACC2G3X5_DALPE|nr:hypothetical protein DPEC_G00221720 [Dallia pectoralis]